MIVNGINSLSTMIAYMINSAGGSAGGSKGPKETKDPAGSSGGAGGSGSAGGTSGGGAGGASGPNGSGGTGASGAGGSGSTGGTSGGGAGGASGPSGSGGPGTSGTGGSGSTGGTSGSGAGGARGPKKNGKSNAASGGYADKTKKSDASKKGDKAKNSKKPGDADKKGKDKTKDIADKARGNIINSGVKAGLKLIWAPLRFVADVFKPIEANPASHEYRCPYKPWKPSQKKTPEEIKKTFQRLWVKPFVFPKRTNPQPIRLGPLSPPNVEKFDKRLPDNKFINSFPKFPSMKNLFPRSKPFIPSTSKTHPQFPQPQFQIGKLRFKSFDHPFFKNSPPVEDKSGNKRQSLLFFPSLFKPLISRTRKNPSIKFKRSKKAKKPKITWPLILERFGCPKPIPKPKPGVLCDPHPCPEPRPEPKPKPECTRPPCPTEPHRRWSFFQRGRLKIQQPNHGNRNSIFKSEAFFERQWEKNWATQEAGE